MEMHQILKIYGNDYKEMTKELLVAADAAALIGDLDKCIGIKPNLVIPSPAEFGATTHPEIIAGIIEYLQEHGFKNLLIAEGSWVGDRTAEAFDICGYRTLSETYGVPLVDTQAEDFHLRDADGLSLAVCDVVSRIDFLINVPVLKGHCQTKVTCALKNLKGLIPNREKRRFHTMGLHKPIAHLQKAIHQDLIIVDHICGDPDFEEGGNPLRRDSVLAALDPVLCDAYSCHLLGYGTDEVPYIGMAEELGVGSTELEEAEVLNLIRQNNVNINLSAVRSSEAESSVSVLRNSVYTAYVPSLSGDPGSLSGQSAAFRYEPDRERPISGRLLDVSYDVEDADSCSACYSNLLDALRRLEEEGLLERLNTTIGIGQGMQGKSGRLGVGRCTNGFDFSIPGCPPDAEVIYEELRNYILS